MFGPSKSDLDSGLAALEQRLSERMDAAVRELRELVERRISLLEGELLAADPAERTRLLLNAAAGAVRADLERTLSEADLLRDRSGRLRTLADELEQAQGELVRRLSGGGAPAERFPAALDTVHRADCLVYVAIYFTGGRTDKVSLLIGEENPPAKSYGELNSGADINSYIGGVVRPGEYWTARSKNRSSGVKCVVTPLY